MLPNTSPGRIAANRANAQKSTGPKSPEGKAKSALNGLVHGLCAQTVVLPGENAEQFEALRAALKDEFQPRTVTEQLLIDTMATSRWVVNRARRQEAAVLTLKMAEAYAQYDAQQVVPPPKPESVDLNTVPWEDRCAVGAAVVKATPQGRAMFLERWRFLRERMVVIDRPTRFLDEMLLMLGHRAGELVEGDPVTEQVTLDWIALWFPFTPPNRHRVSDAIFRCSNLREIELEKEISRLLPKVPSYEEGLKRLLAMIDEQIAELEKPNEPPLDLESEPPTPAPIDRAAREAACAYASFDSSKEGALRLRYITAHDIAYHRALRNLLALRKLRDAGSMVSEPNAPATVSEANPPSEANDGGPPDVPKPREANGDGAPGPVFESIPVEKPMFVPRVTSTNPTQGHPRR